ncbi:arabinosidase [Spirochaetia bacterium]|nr:arabinosidase [Spirochaetia bacterium]
MILEKTVSIIFGGVVFLAILIFGGCGSGPKTVQPAEENYAGYLFAYFTGNEQAEEQLHFAISTGDDPFTFKALNNNEAIIDSADISEMGGIRDPHLIRGEDGTFFMVMTDMASSRGWDSNRGIILLKSENLLDWTSSRINFRAAFGENEAFKTIDHAWAPQSIRDPAAKKYMVYLSMANEGESLPLTFYYAYANSDFTALEAPPVKFYDAFDEAGNRAWAIDADILPYNGKYYLFYKTENSGNNIALAISDTITGPYTLVNRNIDKTDSPVEGCSTYRLYNTDTYVLMYDVYTTGNYEFTTTKDFETFEAVQSSLDFRPRHGSVIPITQTEMDALKGKWGGGK